MSYPALPIDLDLEQFEALLAGQRVLTDDQVVSMYRNVRPTCRSRGYLNYLHTPNPFYRARPDWFLVEGPAVHLNVQDIIYTVHPREGNYDFVLAAVDVFSQIPLRLEEHVVAFETVGPTDIDTIKRQRPAADAGYYVGVTTLYASTH